MAVFLRQARYLRLHKGPRVLGCGTGYGRADGGGVSIARGLILCSIWDRLGRN